MHADGLRTESVSGDEGIGRYRCGDGERSVNRAEQLHGAGPEALVLERHLFPQQQRQRGHVVKDQALLQRLKERDHPQKPDAAFQRIDRALNPPMIIQRFRDQFHAFHA